MFSESQKLLNSSTPMMIYEIFSGLSEYQTDLRNPILVPADRFRKAAGDISGGPNALYHSNHEHQQHQYQPWQTNPKPPPYPSSKSDPKPPSSASTPPKTKKKHHHTSQSPRSSSKEDKARFAAAQLQPRKNAMTKRRYNRRLDRCYLSSIG